MTDLADRYGAPSPARRRVLVGAVAVVAAVFLGWLAWTAVFHATPAVESELTSYDVVDDGSASAVVIVSLADDVVASCRIRAFAEDHSTVGELAFEPVDGRNEVTLLGCTAPGQPRPR